MRAVSARRRWALVVVLLLVLRGAALTARAAGWPLAVGHDRVAAPDAGASPEDVVRTYVEAYNHRDSSTMRQIYPSQRYARSEVLGTMHDLVVVDSRPLTSAEDGNPSAPGRSYHRVGVTLRLSGLEGSDLAYQNGPNGWAYLLERDRSTEPWQIVGHGNP